MEIPEELGGGVRDFRFNAVIAEELQGAGAAAVGLGLTLHNDICVPYSSPSAPTSSDSGGCGASRPGS